MALENVGGRETFFGVLPTKNKFGGKIDYAGSIKEIRYTFPFDDLPTNDTGNEMVIAIPANSLIVSSTLKVGTAFAGGTDLQVGLVRKDGTVISVAGLNAAILTAALTAGAVDSGGGVLIDASSGSADAVVRVTATGTFTAGDATLVVRYQPIGPDAA